MDLMRSWSSRLEVLQYPGIALERRSSSQGQLIDRFLSPRRRCARAIWIKGDFEMYRFIIGAAAVALAAAATVVWSNSIKVEPQATLAAKAPHALIVSPDARVTDGNDHEHGWGPFRTVDW
jgi:hypothetical protein